MNYNDLLKEIRNLSAEKRNLLRRDIDKIEAEIFEAGRDSREETYKKNRIAYQRQKELYAERGRDLLQIIKIGDVIQVRGTKDGKGIRLVTEVSSYGVTCRKLSRSSKQWVADKNVYQKDPYTTEHKYDKLMRIIQPHTYIIED